MVQTKEKTTWRTVRLGDVADFRYGKMPKNTLPIGKYPIYSGYRVTGFTNDEYNSDEDLVIVARGVGGTGDVKISPPKSFVTNLSIIAELDEQRIDKKYSFYFFSKGLRHLDSGSAQSQITIQDLNAISLVLPDIGVQKRIADILSAFDDKIENNNRIIKTLEEMAQAIFKEWFVKFRFPGYEKAEFVNSELGKIPKGWEIKLLRDVVELVYGKALKEENRRDGDVVVVGSSGIVGKHNEELVDGPGIVVGRKGVAGSVIWIDEDFYPIDTTFYVKTNLPLIFCLLMLERANFISGDSAVPGLNREDAYRIEVLVPRKENLELFHQNVEPMFEQRRLLRSENQKLATMRDLLLPRLMSGDILV